jgi:hypothetical protein
MKNLISHIYNKNYDQANQSLSESVMLIMEKKLFEIKKRVAAKMCEQMGILGPTRAEKLRSDVLEAIDPEERTEVSVEKGTPKQKPGSTHYKTTPSNETIVPKNNLKEEETEEQLDEARVKIIKARIRGGKIQRRKKVSNVEGYKVQGGQLKRMSPTERRHRKLGQKRGKMKRRAKMTRTLMKRQKSLRKRKSLGI